MFPDVSVVLISWCPPPAEYRLNLLQATVESLKSCTQETPYSFVVVDNGGKEQTDYVRSIEPDVHIINKVNPGPGIARNQGALARQSKYVAFLDSDIALYNGWLKHALETLGKFPGRKLIVAPTRCSPMRNPSYRLPDIEPGYQLWTMAAGFCLVMPREALHDIGFFCDSYTDPIEDRDFSNRAKEKGWSFIRPMGRYVVHRGKWSTFNHKGHLRRGYFDSGVWT